MFRTIAWYANFILGLILTFPKLRKVKKLEKQGRTAEKAQLVHKTTSKWALSQIKMSGAQVSVYGQENIPSERAVLFVSNHQGNFDVALFMACIDKPKGYMAKIEMKKVPLLRTWMEYMHCVFMDRGKPRKSIAAIAKGIDILKSGYSLVIFPEGTRSKGNKIGEFKAGSFKLATKSGVPIVPVTISGSYRLMEANGGKVKPAEVKMFIHPLVETANLSKEEEDTLPVRVKTVIESKLQ